MGFRLLENLNDHMKTIEYKLNGLKRPRFRSFQRKLLYLNKIPFIRNISWVRYLIFKIYGLNKTATINSDFYLSAPNIELGNNNGLADTYILAYAPIIIGNNCSFSFRNMIITSTHDLNDFSTVIAEQVTIGNNVWVTSNVTILGGVTIGDNTVIGAGSVVTKDIPAGVFAAGNPCKVIRKIDFRK